MPTPPLGPSPRVLAETWLFASVVYQFKKKLKGSAKTVTFEGETAGR